MKKFISKKSIKEYKKMVRHLSRNSKTIDELKNITMGDRYWCNDESLNMYKDIKLYVKRNIKIRKLDQSLDIITLIYVTYGNRIDELINEYCIRRIKILTDYHGRFKL